ncbi:MAG TPA: ATP-binding protein [Anaerolineaceae bacterium]|nr:ATP-binding protein [Anaerolineaceae bacterium]
MHLVDKHPILEELHIKHLITISQIVTEAEEWKPALDKIVKLVRTVFIFDNLVLYLYNETDENMDGVYARAVGRGKISGAEISWGEAIASQVQKTRRTIVEEAPQVKQGDRLQQPCTLAVPLILCSHFLGVLIYLRFGGPSFTAENIQLGEYIAWHISLLIQRQKMLETNLNLETRNKMFQFQDDFVSTISHDLRTPLGCIKGYTTTLLRNDTQWDSQTQHEFLQVIDDETDHLQHLIDNLLDSARLQSGQMQMFFQPVLLDHLLADSIDRTRLHFPGIKLTLENSALLRPVQADPNRLAQVFENILANAAKYAPSQPILVTLEQDSSQVVINIQDQGPGISQMDLPHLFERFYRSAGLQNSVHGAGLGLYICQQIVKAHHGEIAVKSQEGNGTTFSITLPCEQPCQVI